MADIFVSYRRDDSQWPAGRINERLEAVFGAGRVFFDTITIRPGEDFRKVLGAKVGACKVLLAVIGSGWLDILEKRHGESNDFVRIEIAEALRREVRVVPVLIDGAKPPPEARLPDDLKPLAWHHAITVRADTFRPDLDQLIGFLKEFLDDHPAAPTPIVSQPSSARPAGSIAVEAGASGRSAVRYFIPGSGKTEWFKDIDAGPELVVVPAGVFLMGSRAGEGGDDERPQHKVAIAKPFAVCRFGITFAEWDIAVSEGGVEHMPDDSGWGRGQQPVINVSWDDANAYAAWLSQKTGKAYRLLSEAEREYVVRAGTTTAFWWGDSISTRQANYDGNYTYGNGEKGEYRERAVPVDSFEPNAWGLYQVHGNVWEWCEDNWHADYKGAPQDGSVWQGGDPSLRVVRDGSWNDNPDDLRSAIRDGILPVDRYNNIGFRLARTL